MNKKYESPEVEIEIFNTPSSVTTNVSWGGGDEAEF